MIKNDENRDKARDQDTKVSVSAVSVKEQTVIERTLEEHADKTVQNARKQARMQTKHTAQTHTHTETCFRDKSDESTIIHALFFLRR